MFKIIISNAKKYIANDNKKWFDNDAREIIAWLGEYSDSKNSQTAYRVVVLRFYMWMRHNKLELKDINKKIIYDYIHFVRNPYSEWCGKRNKMTSKNWKPFYKPLNPSTICFNMRIIKQMFSELSRYGYLNKNPFYFQIKLASLIRGLPQERYLTKNEFELIDKYISTLPEKSHYQMEVKTRARWIIKVLIYTACRRSEIADATMNDIIFKNGRLWLKVIGKGNKYGEIPILPELEDALNQYRGFYGLSPIDKRINSESNIPLIIKRFHNGEYQKMHNGHLWYIIKSLCNGIADNIPDEMLSNKFKSVTTHWLRHTSATIQVDSGIDIRIVQRNLRHSSIVTTMQYQHVAQDKQFDETALKFKI